MSEIESSLQDAYRSNHPRRRSSTHAPDAGLHAQARQPSPLDHHPRQHRDHQVHLRGPAHAARALTDDRRWGGAPRGGAPPSQRSAHGGGEPGGSPA
jgi:hypothetical protein